MERLIETALTPGHFVSYNANFSFVSGLRTVERELAKLIRTDPTQAVVLYETFLAGCYEKAEEIDDSSGSFGQFVDELYCGWIKARQAAGADPAETATRLLRWMEADPYGFCYDLEKDAAKVLNRAGLAAFMTQIRERFDKKASHANGIHRPWETEEPQDHRVGGTGRPHHGSRRSDGSVPRSCRGSSTLRDNDPRGVGAAARPMGHFTRSEPAGPAARSLAPGVDVWGEVVSSYLADTNILVRMSVPQDLLSAVAKAAVKTLKRQAARVCVAPQTWSSFGRSRHAPDPPKGNGTWRMSTDESPKTRW
jgi:hypothetical protein